MKSRVSRRGEGAVLRESIGTIDRDIFPAISRNESVNSANLYWMFSKEGATFFPFVLPVITEGGSDNCPGEFLLAGRTNGIEKTGARSNIHFFSDGQDRLLLPENNNLYSKGSSVTLGLERNRKIMISKNKACNLFFVFSFVLAGIKRGKREADRRGKKKKDWKDFGKLSRRVLSLIANVSFLIRPLLLRVNKAQLGPPCRPLITLPDVESGRVPELVFGPC